MRSPIDARALLVTCALAAVPACARTDAVAARSMPPTICDRGIITSADVAGLIAGPVTSKTLEGDPQSCELTGAASSSVTISVRPGLGDVTVRSWAENRTPAASVPLSDVGDRAVWQDTLHELIATKHNVLCDIGASGATGSPADIRQKLAALCQKVFAAQ